MIIYNVTLKVAHDIVEDWLKWMKEEHMPALMGTGLFTERRLCRLLEHDEADGATYIAQYICDSVAQYETYIADYAPAMREISFKKFGDKFIAFRTIMEIVDQD